MTVTNQGAGTVTFTMRCGECSGEVSASNPEGLNDAFAAHRREACAVVKARQEAIRETAQWFDHTYAAEVEALGSVLDELSFPLSVRQRAAELLLEVVARKHQ